MTGSNLNPENVSTNSKSPFRQSLLGSIKAEGVDSDDVFSPQRLTLEVRNSAAVRFRPMENRLDLDAAKQRETSVQRRMLNTTTGDSYCSARGVSVLDGHASSSRSVNRLKAKGMLGLGGDLSGDKDTAIAKCDSQFAGSVESTPSSSQNLNSSPRRSLDRSSSSIADVSRPSGQRSPTLKKSSSPSGIQRSSTTTSEAFHGKRTSDRASLQDWGTQSGGWRGWDKWGGWRDKEREEGGSLNATDVLSGKMQEHSLGKDPDKNRSASPSVGSAPNERKNLDSNE